MKMKRKLFLYVFFFFIIDVRTFKKSIHKKKCKFIQNSTEDMFIKYYSFHDTHPMFSTKTVFSAKQLY